MHYGISGKQYTLSNTPLKSGGEGSIFAVSGNANVLAKIYHQNVLNQELEDKIKTMYQNPPVQDVLTQIAWPIDVLYNSQRQFCGFLMNKLNVTHELGAIYKYPPEELKGVTLQHKLIIAQNICLVISAVHRAGYVFGDFNPMNIGVNIKNGTVAFFDADTYHFKDSQTGHMHRCKVGCPGYVAPELIATCKKFSAAHPEIKDTYAHAPLPTFTVATDNFALAIHIFRLLMNGYTPYNGIPETASVSLASPGRGDVAVERNNYCFAPGNKPMSAATPEMASLPQEVQALFTRAFGTGYAVPSARPSSDEWMNALASFEQELKRCNKDSNHLYYKGLSTCPLCAADERYRQALIVGSTPSLKQKTFKTAPIVQVPATPPRLTNAQTSSNSYTPQHATASAATAQYGTSQNTMSASTKTVIAVVIVAIILVFSSVMRNVDRDTVDFITGDTSIAVGDTIQVRVNSTTSELTASYSQNIEVNWNNSKKSGKTYVLDVTGLSAGRAELTVYKQNNEKKGDTITITVVPSTTEEIRDNGEEYGYTGTEGDPASAVPQVMMIDSISENQTKITAIADSEFSVDPLSLGAVSGSINGDGQKDEYTFSPSVAGTYRFEFSNVPDGTDLRLRIMTSGRETIKSDYDMDDGDGLTLSMSNTNTYIVQVEQYRGYGNYTLNIGEQKPTFDISAATLVYDSIQFVDQENNYQFTPSVSGTYRFEFGSVPDGTDLRLGIYNSGWETIKSDYDLDTGDGLTQTMTAGKTYFIRVKQYRSVGSYSLLIGHQKELIDVSSHNIVSDSIQFTDQRNNYEFNADISGTYRFEFSDVPDGTDLQMIINNSGWETIKSDYDLDDGDGLTITLNQGQKIYITVTYYRNFGSYSLNIGKQKETVDITDNPSVSDSIQFTDQRNNYFFTAPADGTYRFEFSDVREGADFKMIISNAGWESIKSDYDLDTGDGLSINMSAGQSIYVTVAYYRNYGSYILNWTIS